MIKSALEDPATRALVKVVGALAGVDPADRARVVAFAQESLERQEMLQAQLPLEAAEADLASEPELQSDG